MFGSVTAWFFNSVAGIKTDPRFPGMQHFILSPELYDSLTFCSAGCSSPYGDIRSKWEIKDNTFIYNVTIPANASADVYLPASNPQDITESGRQLTGIKEISSIHSADNKTCCTLESGSYSFIVKLRK
jgi:hypothetical protein